MHKDVIEAIDQIDAAIFSSDTFYFKEDRMTMKENLDRWSRELASIQKAAEDEGFDL